jgi:RNA polymerase II C-terminal domain phosphatase-like 3/4
LGWLDLDSFYIGGKIMSRDESTQPKTKSLDVIQGVDPAMVVILNDTIVVWPGHLHSRDRILMDKYHYFASTYRALSYGDIPFLAEHGMDKREHAGSLALVLSALRCIHQRFLSHDRPNIRELVTKVWRQVLPGYMAAFSFLEQVMPKTTHTWRRLAEALDIVCMEDINEMVTHIIAEDPVLERAQWARDNLKFCCQPEVGQGSKFLVVLVGRGNVPGKGGEFLVVPAGQGSAPGEGV